MAKHTFLIGFIALVVAGCGAASSAPATTTTPIVQLHQFKFLFPEGFTREQTIARVALDLSIAKAKQKKAHRPRRFAMTEASYAKVSGHAVVPCFGTQVQKNLEGFLFPAEYDFDTKTTASILLRDQLQAFCENWSSLDLAYARSKNLTPYDVLKIASMVEEETALPSERKLVAGVIYNRLRDGMPLGIDATLRYGLHIPPTESIHESQLQNPTPYNTRLHAGLPPTPIGNPGLASMQAAAHPSKLGYLYYARVPGTRRQEFFESYSQYQAFLATHGYGPHS